MTGQGREGKSSQALPQNPREESKALALHLTRKIQSLLRCIAYAELMAETGQRPTQPEYLERAQTYPEYHSPNTQEWREALLSQTGQ